MPLVIPNIESSPAYDAQSVSDYTDWLASTLATSGTGVLSGASISPHTGSDMAVVNAAGTVAVANQQYAITPVTSVISPASATDRRDIVIYTPGTGVETSGSSTINSAACTGNPCGTNVWTRHSAGLPPIKPLIPAGSVLLAEVYVTGSTTAITSNNLTDKTTLVNLGGVTSDYTVEFPFTFGPGLASGVEFYTPPDGSFILDWWIVINSAASGGITPQFDMGFLTGGSTSGILGTLGLAPIPLWVPEQNIGGVPGSSSLTTSPQLSSFSSILANAIYNNQLFFRPELFVQNSAAAQLSMIASQDGTAQTAQASSLLGTTAPTLSLTITHNINDQFFYQWAAPTGGIVTGEQFVFNTGGSASVFTSLSSLATAMMGASNPSSGDTFGMYATVVPNGSVLEIQGVSNTGSLVPAGAGSDGAQLTAGTHDATAQLGFTTPGVLSGGLGGNPGSSGSATLYLKVVSP